MKHLAYRTYQMSPLNAGHVVVDGKIVYAEPRRNKVAICGAGLGRSYAPLGDPSWEVWAINLIAPISAGCLRADLWFDLHQRKAQTDLDMAWIAKCPVPIYVPPDLVSAGPNCVEFPLASLRTQGPFACTFAYQIALAIHENATDIGLFGIELRYGTPRERTVEWASVNWWMGYAEALGVRVHVPSGSWLGCHPKLYGFEYDEEIVAVNEYLDTMKSMDEVEANRASVGG